GTTDSDTALDTLSFVLRRPPGPTVFPYTTLFRSTGRAPRADGAARAAATAGATGPAGVLGTANATPAADTRDSAAETGAPRAARSEEHTSELQSRENLVCRLLLEKKKNKS